MIEFVLGESDLADVRFAVSPLSELTLSLRVLKDPAKYPLHLPWVRRVRDVDAEVLLALSTDRGWTPDFLSPRPSTPFTRIEDELAALGEISTRVMRRDLRAVLGDVPSVLRDRDRVLEALRHYWDIALAPHWDRVRAVLEADIAHRGREMARRGLAAMLSGISGRITFASPVVRVRIAGVEPWRQEAGGHGLTLVPSVFTRHTAVPVDHAAPPLLIYAARGAGTLWETGRDPAPAALAGVLGQVRADLLVGLDEPRSSTDVARRTGVTTSAVNQHLRAMRAAGLLASQRHGRSVVYARSELGDALVSHSVERGSVAAGTRLA
ncbi:ArsR/SmtB family transcription factor [Lentzea sp.]|uniref:ArsR/SmtB family transcription factor n=1 Tax=Lentzea sp. TaxID=56099 RepID=UPI002ED5E5B5